ncbi:MAG TPA: helix-turn-helix transcriptional regulator [Leptospiraceae bacterium]|nr:helix-turn-helix transcriptional regulator [Leptospiraceae bacterium]HMW06899.1 helix-turn-helix transcriptional regulator [Leptospiraceae bacterium]HMX35042.1 helix-turn-helix transcriptional regulator [Leptospiraceae bacterium]HMY33429.1 helix-turn-helix transcriptional regulator [Leptospiraceae bacterium]HNC55759.1 helix-turn-helix transcriptional regulator [Leptospiraceae bacterium]
MKTHHIKIIIEAKTIPIKLANFLKKEYGTQYRVLTNKEDNDGNPLIAKNTKWYKDIKNKITPADSLKIYRQNKGLSQSQLAKKLGVLPSNISEMERGKRGISKEMAKNLSNLFETSIDKFI